MGEFSAAQVAGPTWTESQHIVAGHNQITYVAEMPQWGDFAHWAALRLFPVFLNQITNSDGRTVRAFRAGEWGNS
jgi:hypothetical protein